MSVKEFSLNMRQLRVLGPERIKGIFERIGFRQLTIVEAA